MSTNIENAIFKAKVDGELKDLFFKTGVDNVIITEGETDITLTQKLSEIISSLENTMTLDAVEDKIAASIAEIVDSAPESLDTLRELAEAISENADIVDSLNDVIANKVSIEDGKDLISTALIDSLNNLDLDFLATLSAEKIAELAGGEDNVIESISVNGTALDITDKSVDIAVPNITIGSVEPASMNDGDLFLQIIE